MPSNIAGFGLTWEALGDPKSFCGALWRMFPFLWILMASWSQSDGRLSSLVDKAALREGPHIVTGRTPGCHTQPAAVTSQQQLGTWGYS